MKAANCLDASGNARSTLRIRCYDASDFIQHAATHSLGLGRQTPALIVVESKSSVPKLFPKDAILLTKVVNGELLLLVHPSGHRDQQKPKWVESSLGLQNTLSQPLNQRLSSCLVNNFEILDVTGSSG